MSHDEIGGTVTRKERRKAFGGKRQKLPPRPFKASDYVRQDWGPADLIAQLYSRARGYNGILRQLLCTAAALIKHQTTVITGYRDQAISEAVEAEMVAPVVSKRNQQPGRLSGSEREALKKFMELVIRSEASMTDKDVMAEGRKMLTKVRKRALGVNAVEVSDEDIVTGMMDPEAQGEHVEMPDTMIRAGEVGA